MQRQCDGGKGDMSPEEWAKVIAARMTQGISISGCGTWFQWYWGSGCACPTCGIIWSVTMADKERYHVRNSPPPFDEREIEERVLRSVLARMGKLY